MNPHPITKTIGAAFVFVFDPKIKKLQPDKDYPVFMKMMQKTDTFLKNCLKFDPTIFPK